MHFRLQRAGAVHGLPSLPSLSVLLILSGLALTTGCEEERNVGGAPGGQVKSSKPAPPKPEFIVGKRTQDVRNAGTEVSKEVRGSPAPRSPRKTRSRSRETPMSR